MLALFLWGDEEGIVGLLFDILTVLRDCMLGSVEEPVWLKQ